MSDEQADTIVILSTELIANIVEEYFNKTMFKQSVSVVDSGPHGSAGYMFSVAFNKKRESVKVLNRPSVNDLVSQVNLENLQKQRESIDLQIEESVDLEHKRESSDAVKLTGIITKVS
jgi:hypothetical protein